MKQCFQVELKDLCAIFVFVLIMKHIKSRISVWYGWLNSWDSSLYSLKIVLNKKFLIPLMVVEFNYSLYNCMFCFDLCSRLLMKFTSTNQLWSKVFCTRFCSVLNETIEDSDTLMLHCARSNYTSFYNVIQCAQLLIRNLEYLFAQARNSRECSKSESYKNAIQNKSWKVWFSSRETYILLISVLCVSRL